MISRNSKLCLSILSRAPKSTYIQGINKNNILFRMNKPLSLSQRYQFPFANVKEANENLSATTTESVVNNEESSANEDQNQDNKETRTNFIEYMTTAPDPSDLIYEYTNKTVYDLNSNLAGRKSNKNIQFIISSVLGLSSMATLGFLNPWVTIIPGALFAGSLMSMRMSSQFERKMIQKIELTDIYHMKVFTLESGDEGLICNIESSEILNVHPIDAEGPDGAENKTSRVYMMQMNLVDGINQKNYKGMRLMIDLNKDSIENMDLFKCMLWGKSNLVANFRRIEYVNTPTDNKAGSAEN